MTSRKKYPWNYWYPILETQDIRPGKRQKKIKRFDEDLVLWRESNGRLHCLSDRCPHRGTSLSLGKLVNNELQCAYHGFRFKGDGQCTAIPANGKSRPIPKGFCAKHFHTQEKYGFIWLWWGDVNVDRPEIPWFEELEKCHPDLTTGSRETPVSFCRWMEANLDCHHFMWVHTSYKIPGVGPMSDPYHVRVDGDLIETWGAFRPDDGSTKEESPGAGFRNLVRFPALMMHEMTEKKFRGICISAPVDDENCWFAVRYYHERKQFNIPVIGKWISAFFTQFLAMKIIHAQDLRVQTQQRPRFTGLGTNQLVADADQGTAEFLKMWNDTLTRQNSRPKVFSSSETQEGRHDSPPLSH